MLFTSRDFKSGCQRQIFKTLFGMRERGGLSVKTPQVALESCVKQLPEFMFCGHTDNVIPSLLSSGWIKRLPLA
jgi:hypothetical protein